MTHPNLQVVRNLFDAIGRQDQAAIRQFLAPEVVYHVPGHHRFAGDYQGIDAVLDLRARQREYRGETSRSHEWVITMGVSDDHVFVWFRGEAESPRTGQPIHWHALTVYEIRDGRVVDARTHLDNMDAWDELWS